MKPATLFPLLGFVASMEFDWIEPGSGISEASAEVKAVLKAKEVEYNVQKKRVLEAVNDLRADMRSQLLEYSQTHTKGEAFSFREALVEKFSPFLLDDEQLDEELKKNKEGECGRFYRRGSFILTDEYCNCVARVYDEYNDYLVGIPGKLERVRNNEEGQGVQEYEEE